MTGATKPSPWVWISLGLIVGLFVAFILFLDQNIVKSGSQLNRPSEEKGFNTKPVFDFYTVLPERKMDAPVQDKNSIDIPDVINRKKASTGKYLIQAGSFKKMQDADRRKAELAFLGLESTVKKAIIKSATYYRVEMGPFSDSQYSKIQKNLIANDIDFFAKSIP